MTLKQGVINDVVLMSIMFYVNYLSVLQINFIVIVSIFRKMAQTTMLKGRSAKQKIT